MRNLKLKISHEKGTGWITVKGDAWKRYGYPCECIDRFGDVWLKPYFGARDVYVTAEGADLIFVDDNGYLKDIEEGSD